MAKLEPLKSRVVVLAFKIIVLKAIIFENVKQFLVSSHLYRLQMVVVPMVFRHFFNIACRVLPAIKVLMELSALFANENTQMHDEMGGCLLLAVNTEFVESVPFLGFLQEVSYRLWLRQL